MAFAGAAAIFHQWAQARPLWLDEQMIALNLRDRSLVSLAGPLWLDQSAPLAWMWLQRAAITLFGTSEPALRLVPACFGVGTLLVAVWIGRRWLGIIGSCALVVLVATARWTSHWALELKPYSADTFWALLLVGLAAWACECTARDLRRRTTVWWLSAAAGIWFSNAAILVAPAGAVVLSVASLARHGLATAIRASTAAIVFAASLALNYGLVLRHTAQSDFLQGFWKFALPPSDAGIMGTLGWLFSRREVFAAKPLGSEQWLALCLCCVAGLAFATWRHRAFGAGLSLAIASGFAWAALGIYPLFHRLSLWMVPPIYAGIASAFDGVVWLALRSRMPRLASAPLALAGGAALLSVSDGIVTTDTWTRSTAINHDLDDRAGVQWLMERREPGDAILTTKFGLPALWWYGDIPVGPPHEGGRVAQGGQAIVEVDDAPAPAGCVERSLASALHGHDRALVYLGWRYDSPGGFDELLIDELRTLGRFTANRSFEGVGRGFVVDLRLPGEEAPLHATASDPGLAPEIEPSQSCVVARPARRG